jgi:hypothetical protein
VLRARRSHGCAAFTQAPRSALGDVSIEKRIDGERMPLRRIRSPMRLSRVHGSGLILRVLLLLIGQGV